MPEENQQPQQKITPEQQIEHLSNALREREELFYNKLMELNELFQDLRGLDELSNKIHAQRAVISDYYFKMRSWHTQNLVNYRYKYAEAYNRVKSGDFNGLKYTADTQINIQAESLLWIDKKQIDIMDVHLKYVADMLKSVDNMIYAITTKIKIYEMLGQARIPK